MAPEGHLDLKLGFRRMQSLEHTLVVCPGGLGRDSLHLTLTDKNYPAERKVRVMKIWL